MRVVLACAAALLSIPSLTSAQASNPLAATYTVRVGDVAAATLSEFLKMRADLRANAIVTYEPDPGTIDVEVFVTGQGASTDAARAVLGSYWEFIQVGHIPYIERRFKTKLTAAHYRLVYYVTRGQGEPQVVLQFVNGQFTIP
jgi:hypothetical protein